MHSSAWLRREDSRIHEHLLGALDALRSADAIETRDAVRTARERNVAELERYVLAGRYPRNTSSEEQQPALIDEHGTRCALAHLIEKSGHGALLERLRRIDNHAWVRELAGDGELVAWLAAEGLTATEAARIQPSYRPPPTSLECACSSMVLGAAVGKVTSAPSASDSNVWTPCEVTIEAILTPTLDERAQLSVGAEIATTCSARPQVGARMLVLERTRYTIDPGSAAFPIVSNAVTFPATCIGGGAHIGFRETPPETVLFSRIVEAAKGSSYACAALLKGETPSPPPTPPPPTPTPPPPTPPPPTPPPPTPPAPRPKPGPSVPPTKPSSQTKPVPVESVPKPADHQEEHLAPLEKPFPQPLYYLGVGGALLIAGTAAYVVLRSRA